MSFFPRLYSYRRVLIRLRIAMRKPSSFFILTCSYDDLFGGIIISFRSIAQNRIAIVPDDSFLPLVRLRTLFVLFLISMGNDNFCLINSNILSIFLMIFPRLSLIMHSFTTATSKDSTCTSNI